MKQEKSFFAIPIVITLITSFTLGLIVLYKFHPHEDAYIMYKYVRNLSSGHGVVFNIGGPHSEGATDFLWMILLSGLNFIGFDPAIASITVNSIANAFILFLFSKAIIKSNISSNFTKLALTITLATALPITGAMISSYVGFATTFYLSAIIGCFYIFLFGSGKTLAYLPAAALILSLIRPDGVIWATLLFAGTTIKIYIIEKDFQHKKLFARWTLATISIGVVYFISRYLYFGFPLPLPLIVKSQGHAPWPGLKSNLGWLKSNEGYYFIFVYVQTLIMGLINTRTRIITTISLAIPLAYFSTLLVATQSQNIFSRFQDPLILTTLLISTYTILNFRDKRVHSIVLINFFLLFFTVEGFSIQKHGMNTYIDDFSLTLGKTLTKDDKVLITEAGRIPYWSKAHFYDIVGLNNPDMVNFDYSISYASTKQPQLVMYFCGNILEANVKEEFKGKPYFKVENFSKVINQTYRNMVLSYNFSSKDKLTSKANIYLSKYLLSHESEFNFFFVNYLGDFNHLYAIRKSSKNLRSFQQILKDSLSRDIKSYAELRSFPFARKK